MENLNLDRILTASPYVVEEVSNGVYLFETDFNVLYKIEFEEMTTIINILSYQGASVMRMWTTMSVLL